MLSNTGTVSFWLYLFIVIIGVFSLLLVYRLIKKGEIIQDNLDKFIDYFKWVIVSLAISTVTLIVSDLFKERDQDIKELEYFDKYVNDVREQKDPLVRLQLAKYLSIVAPSGDMKESWKAYYDVVKEEYDAYLKAQENVKNDTVIGLTNEQKKKIEESQKKIDLFETPLSGTSKYSEWYIIAGGDPDMDQAKPELEKAFKINGNSAIIKKGNSYRTVLMGYTSKTEAESQLQMVRDKINKTSYIVRKTSWCNSYEKSEECLICK